MSDRETTKDYHRRTYHRFERYAAGPEMLDWEMQPDPFRRFTGARLIELPLAADKLTTPFSALGTAAPQPFDVEHLGMLFELSFAISAWKAYGPDRWALRCNPSSGNLHPTESYAVPLAVDGIDADVYHYRADKHALERRCRTESMRAGAEGILVGLSSVHWREAWKYGERAFRYSQLDTGHAIAALRYAAAALGWECTQLRDWAGGDIAELLGLNRIADFADAEAESPEALLWVHRASPPPDRAMLLDATRNGDWTGTANRLDAKPMYDWPVIDAVDKATAIPALAPLEPVAGSFAEPQPSSCSKSAAAIIRRRRSAQQFDPRTTLPQADFFHMLDQLLPRAGSVPWDTGTTPVRTQLILFVHRVEGLRPGLYALLRHPDALTGLKAAMRSEFLWQHVQEAPAGLPFYLLIHANAQRAARTLSCHQDIAGNSAFAVSMLGGFDDALQEGAWNYRHLFWEAGMIGQVLYLEAEAAGIRGTGIGCYFDPAVHETLGINDTRLQSMYHFTVGTPLVDSRLQTLPPYTRD